MSKTRKIILYSVSGVLLLTIVWNIALHFVLLPKYFYQTEARVIELRTKRPGTSRGGSQTNQFPTYRYKDDKGEIRVFESQDGFNSFNGFLFKKEVGQTVKAYYGKNSPKVLIVTGTGDWYTFLFAPAVFAMFPLGLVGFVLYKKNKRL